ncbi:MAG: class I SAM-dependent methyltransferase [Desulfomonilaceae bacterium]
MRFSSRFKRRGGELLAGVVLALDLTWWGTHFLAACSVCLFFLSYAWYRREAVLNFSRSEPVRGRMTLSLIRALEKEYTQRLDYNSPEKRAMVRTGVDRYFYFVRYERVQALLNVFLGDAERVLDMGCGFGKNTVYVSERLNRPVVALDLDELKLAWAKNDSLARDLPRNIDFVCADAACPPLRPRSFNCIVMTETLEHLIRPNECLTACHELLCEAGILIITVPSCHNLAYSNNPFIVLEKILSLLDDRVLPTYHSLHAKFEYNWRRPEPEYGVHFNFSRQQLGRLLQDAGFTVIRRESFEVEVFPYLVIELLFQGDLERVRKYVAPLEALITRLPVIGSLGQHLVWVARKEDRNGDN